MVDGPTLPPPTTSDLFHAPTTEPPSTAQKVQRAETSTPNEPGPTGSKYLDNLPRAEHGRYDPPPANHIELSFRHSFWQARRTRIRAAMEIAGVTGARKLAFDQCGGDALVMQEKHTGQLRIVAHHCHDRFCEACQQARSARIRAGLARQVPKAKCLHIVLTWQSNDKPLKDQLRELYAAASKLRSRPFWKKRVAGGSQTLELTRNADTGLWHPHLHCLVHSDWVPLPELSKEWRKVTGHSHRVHVSLVSKTDSAVREVTKYLAKPIHRSVDFLPSALVELLVALKGKRMITTFGTWRKQPLLEEHKPDASEEWIVWGTLTALHHQAAAGDAWAKQALLHLTGRGFAAPRRSAPTKPPAG